MTKDEKFDWNKSASLRIPVSVMNQLDDFKEKHGYTSRPQAIIASLEKATRNDNIEDIRKLLKKHFTK